MPKEYICAICRVLCPPCPWPLQAQVRQRGPRRHNGRRVQREQLLEVAAHRIRQIEAVLDLCIRHQGGEGLC